MGTRHLIAIQSGGEYKLGQYGQWDGYPSAAGVDVLQFLKGIQEDDVMDIRDEENHTWSMFTRKVNSLTQATEEELKESWVKCGADPDTNMVTMDVANKHAEEYPQFSRETSADMLSLIMSSPDGLKIDNRLSFAAESLFCEWAYVIDLDKRTFEVFRGFNKEPLIEGDRFFSLQKGAVNELDSYFPVRLVKSYSLDDLPEDLNECDPVEED